MRRLLKKETRWECTPEVNEDFKNLKKGITESPCLAHFDPKKENYVTTDASTRDSERHCGRKRGKSLDPFRSLVDSSRIVREKTPLMN